MATILITNGVPTDGIELLAGHRVIIPEPEKAFTKDELDKYIVDADAVLAVGQVTGDTIRRGKNLRIIANYGAGYDRVDLKAADECGIPVTNIPDTVTRSTAELAIGLILALSRKIGEMNLRLRTEATEPYFSAGHEMGLNLYGRTLGIIGLGRIGGETARLASLLGMNVLGYSRHPQNCPYAKQVSLDELLHESDIISIHCPLNDASRGMIGSEQIAAMKDGVMFVNTSRGAVLDTDALCDAIETGHVRAAALDVFPNEPQIPERVKTMPQILLTPHIGTNTYQARKAMMTDCCRQMLDAISGKTPAPIVNHPCNG